MALMTLVLPALAACGRDGQSSFAEVLNLRGQTEVAPGATGGSGRTVGEDVEAPEVFAVTEEGLWDGRPSLGGIWVAHPDVSEPERVIIRNPSNGMSVIGALFRRERDVPGPPLQISSDAANALRMVAGEPQELGVTALRRRETTEEATGTDEAASSAAPADVTEYTLDPATIADAASQSEAD